MQRFGLISRDTDAVLVKLSQKKIYEVFNGF